MHDLANLPCINAEGKNGSPVGAVKRGKAVAVFLRIRAIFTARAVTERQNHCRNGFGINDLAAGVTVEVFGSFNVPPLGVRLGKKRKGKLLVHIQIGYQRAEVQLSFLVDNKGRGKKVRYVAHDLAYAFSNRVLKFCFHTLCRLSLFPAIGAFFFAKKRQLLLKILKQSSIISITYIIHHFIRFDKSFF